LKKVNSISLPITGAPGFVGSASVRQRTVKDFQCIVLDALNYADHSENLDPLAIPGPGKVTLVEGNICDLQRAVHWRSTTLIAATLRIPLCK
jgi:dTDP-D-glucose 4,6-dehydratase